MADINCVSLTGRLTRDAELKYGANGTTVVRFSMAVNRSKRNADGSWSDEASYFDCVYFGKSAEAVSSYLTKGRQVAVSGELRQSRWESEGQSRSRVEIFITNLALLSQGGSRGDSQGDGQFQQRTAPQQGGYQSQNSYQKPRDSYRQAPQPQDGPDGFIDDNIPF